MADKYVCKNCNDERERQDEIVKQRQTKLRIQMNEKIKNFAEEKAKQMENLIILELQKETVEEKDGKIVWTQKARLRMQDREDWKNEIKTSKTFKKEETKREKWIDKFEERYAINRDIILDCEDCKEIADLLREKSNPAKTIAYLMQVRMGKETSQKGMTLNNEEIWMFKKEDILKIEDYYG